MTALVSIVPQSGKFALICGLPTSLLYMATDFARDLMHRAHGACDLVHCNALSAETRTQLAACGVAGLGLGEIPDGDVVAFAQTGRFPVLLIDQAFGDACRKFMHAREQTLLDTVRTLSRAQVGAIALAAIPRTEVIGPGLAVPARVFVEQIACALDIDKSIWGALCADRELDRPLAALIEQHFGSQAFQCDEAVDRVLAKLDEFYGIDMPKSASQWQFPIELLLEGKPPHLPPTEVIDLVGPARCLTFGPHFCLPAGRWAGRLQFATAGNVPANTFGFDFIADQEIKFDRQFDVGVSGIYQFDFSINLENPFLPFEIRTFIRRGSISGNFKLNSVCIWPENKP